MAATQPDGTAIKIPRGTRGDGAIDYLTLSFRELESEAAAWQRNMEKARIRRGDRTLVMVKPGLPLIAAVFALFAQGAVPIVIDPGMGLRSFLRCVRHSRPSALVGIPIALAISHVARTAFRGVRARICASGRSVARLTKPGSPSLALCVAPSAPQELAAILFTSGSTGAPKGVCYEHSMFEAQVRMLRDTYGLRPGEIDLPMLPIFALFNPALGITTIVPEIDPRRPASMDPARIVKAICQEKVTNSFGSPTLWRRIADHCIEKQITLPGLKRVLCAGAPVPASLWKDAPRFLTGGLLHSPYGATEALPVSSVSSDNPCLGSLDGACVGLPVREVEARIIAISDATIASIADAPALATGQIGEIIIRSPSATTTYDALPEATAQAKIPDPQGGIWHRMGDAGFLDAKGQLWFCGRKVERVVTSTDTFHTEPCERVFRRHPRARRCALIRVEINGRVQPALVVETKVRNSSEARTLARELHLLAQQHTHTAAIQVFYFHPSFPVDVRHNAKIHRLSLARWAIRTTGYRSSPKR